jgi:glycosyltransferase involved in cell wall biosynthesis
MSAPTVLLTTDGTYPCYRGGVSVWCDQLIRELPEVQFHVFAIGYSPSHSAIFPRPPNVLSQQILPLWGTEEPGVRQESLAAALRRKWKTTAVAIRSGFLDSFECCVRSILERPYSPDALADAFVDMHLFFRDFDYAGTFSSAEVWDAFLRLCCDIYPPSERLSLEEATTCLRWLTRYLAVLTVPFPETDIVHTSMSGLAGVPGVLQKKLTGSQYVVTEHGIFLRELYMSLAKMNHSLKCRRFLFAFYEVLARMNYSFADEITSLCEFNRKWQVRMGAPADKIRITPNGVDPLIFRPPSGEVQNRAAGYGPVVLTMARIYPLKGIDTLIETAHLVLKEIPSVRWRILGDVGDRAYYNSCRDLADRLGIAGSIEWGQSSTPAVEYRKADLFFLPSISEAMPYCVIEAMLSGCPVVATDVGGVAELLAGTGLIAPPRDPESLAASIVSLLSPGALEKRAALADRAFDRALALYTLEKCSDQFREIYGELSSSARTASLSVAG